MNWTIPNITVGDKVKMLSDYTYPSGFLLEKDREFTVSDIGERYCLPFVYIEELGYELQLQPRTYKKLTKMESFSEIERM